MRLKSNNFYAMNEKLKGEGKKGKKAKTPLRLPSLLHAGLHIHVASAALGVFIDCIEDALFSRVGRWRGAATEATVDIEAFRVIAVCLQSFLLCLR